MEPVVKNVILASADQVAIDAVAAGLMGFDPLDIKYIRLAHETGLGVGDPREIEIVGDDVAGESWGFHVGYSPTHFWPGFMVWSQQGAPEGDIPEPLCDRTHLRGEVEQDWLYWPLKFRHVAEEWLTGTEWGRLFQQYQEQGCLTVRSAA